MIYYFSTTKYLPTVPYFILCFSLFILIASIIIALSITASLSKSTRYNLRSLVIDEDKKINWRIVGVLIMVTVGIVIITRYSYFANEQLELIKQIPEGEDKKHGSAIADVLSSYGVIGDFIGGFVGVIFNLVGIILLFETLSLQRREIKDGRESFDRQQFESRFFKFIDYHRDNVSQLTYRKPESKGEKFWNGIQVFNIIHFEVTDLIAAVISSVAPELKTTKQKIELINFAYQCVFYGTGKRDAIHVLKAHFPDKSSYFETVKFKLANGTEQTLGSRTTAYSKNQVYYTGHVNRLGRYFRNIYQAIKYVESQKNLKAKEKYDYIRHLRAQFTAYEQVVFFYNSLSDLGDAWEQKVFTTSYPMEFNEKVKTFRGLFVTKYDLIRNTIFNYNKGKIAIYDKGSEDVLLEFSLKEFYPLLTLESEEECSVNGILPFKDNKSHICRFCFNEQYIGYPNEDAEKKITEHFTEEQGSKDRAIKKMFRCDEKNCSTTELIRVKTKYLA